MVLAEKNGGSYLATPFFLVFDLLRFGLLTKSTRAPQLMARSSNSLHHCRSQCVAFHGEPEAEGTRSDRQ